MLSFPFFNFYRFKKIKIRKKKRNFTQAIFYVKNRENIILFACKFWIFNKKSKAVSFLSEHFPT